MGKYSEIHLLIPTYGRAKTSLPGCIDSFIERATNPLGVHFHCMVNAKDMDTQEYLDAHIHPHISYEIEVLPQPHLSYYWNTLYDLVSKGDKGKHVYGYVGDDMVAETPGYDTNIYEVLNVSHGCQAVTCNDRYLGGQSGLPVNLFISKKLIDATEKPFVHPGFYAEGSDWVWQQILQPYGLLYYAHDTVIIHNHATKSKEFDDTYSRLQETLKNNKVTSKECSKYIREAIGCIKKNLTYPS